MNKYILPLLIVLLFLFSRLYKITEVPASLYWDEASIGYNAYSVLKTGRDEWGEFLPLHFRSFGEFKLPVYIYTVMGAELIFGLSQFAVRLPAVIFGLLSIWGLYLVTKKMTKDATVSLLSSFLFSITPWFFIFSRTGYEASSGLAFFIFAIYFLILSFEKSSRLIISTFLFILSAYSYNSFRILSPLFLTIGMTYFAYKTKQKGFFILLISAGIFILSLLPIYKLYSKDAGLSRLQTVKATKNILTNYLSHLSFSFLFVEGDSNSRSQMPGSPELFLIDFPFIVLGLFYIIKKHSVKYYAIPITLLASFIPAAITKESPHALRSILAAPSFALITSLGIYQLTKYFKKYNKYILGSIVGLYLIFFGNYYCRYISSYNLLTWLDWQYPYKAIFTSRKKGAISDEYAQPYIFALFYTKADPKMFLATKKLNPVSDWGFSTVKSFGDFEFIKHE